MSLKAFHIFFIFSSVVLTAGFGWWALGVYFWMGIASLVTTVLLIVYLFWFVTKLLVHEPAKNL